MRIGALSCALLCAFGGLSGCAKPECTGETAICSEDGLTLTTCSKGHQKITHCMQEKGQLCEAGACVDPWQYGAPAFDHCEGEPLATSQSLAEKAVGYEEIARRLHVNPTLKWLAPIRLKATDADPKVPKVDAAHATQADVEEWDSGDNDGLWSGLYLAAEAFRYATTHDAEALSMVKVLMDGERIRMKITGVPGVFTRSYAPGDLAGISCPTDLTRYTPGQSEKKTTWLKVKEDGCAYQTKPDTQEWVKTSVCGLNDFVNWCFKDDVSKDEYSGHMFALAVVARLVDDPQVHALAADMLGQVADHLIQNRLTLVDWDGQQMTFGAFWAQAFDDLPGFNAGMALSFMLVSAEATGRADLRDYYETCLLQKGPEFKDCLMRPTETPAPYTDYLSQANLFPAPIGCNANYNNISMHMLSLFDLIWFERDPETRATYQQSLDIDVVRPPDQPRAVQYEKNAWFDIMWAAMKKLGPGSDGPAFGAVKEALCQLRQFPATYEEKNISLNPDQVGYCIDRFHRDSLEHPREIAQRCPDSFVWWRSPFDMGTCTADPTRIESPQSYLLPYWMGRYFGFIRATD